MEEWEYHSTYSGTPQGGIISPLFANIYLNELDKYISTLAENFEKPGDTICTPEYGTIKRQRLKLSEAIKRATEPERTDCSGNIMPYTPNSLKHHISRRRIRKSSIPLRR